MRVPPTRSTPASFTADAQLFASIAASSATGPEKTSASNASASIAAACGSSAIAAAENPTTIAALRRRPVTFFIRFKRFIIVLPIQKKVIFIILYIPYCVNRKYKKQ